MKKHEKKILNTMICVKINDQQFFITMCFIMFHQINPRTGFCWSIAGSYSHQVLRKNGALGMMVQHTDQLTGRGFLVNTGTAFCSTSPRGQPPGLSMLALPKPTSNTGAPPPIHWPPLWVTGCFPIIGKDFLCNKRLIVMLPATAWLAPPPVADSRSSWDIPQAR